MVNELIGKKLGMSQIFTEDGTVIPVTLVQAGPCIVIQKKIKDKDGYDALQIGFGTKKAKNASKPLKGHQDKAGKGYFSLLKEIDCKDITSVNIGDEIRVESVFQKGEKIKVSGKSKGKGFAGVVKRYGFGGHRASHGALIHRTPGSIGASADPSRVLKGKKMPGQMGNVNVTVLSLEVVDLKPEENLIVIKGSIPGPNGQIVIMKRQGV
jgi:large subunit ribosomal protein L3